MTGRDLLKGMSYVNAKYVEEADKAEALEEKSRVRRLGGRRALLAAAVIAMMLMLVGCAVVYVMKMQDMKVGEQTETQYVFATDGMSILGTEEVSQQVLTLNGLKGSPGYQAVLEWYEFKQEYDPDHILHMQMREEGTVPEFPAEYGEYNIYSNEMKDKLDAILETYGLKPTGASLAFRTVKNMCEALGVARIQALENGVTVSVNSGGCRENGNFSLGLDFVLPEDPENEIDTTWGTLRWNRKDCFSEDLITINDTGDWQEWNYTTTSGSEVLIIRSESDWRGWIICERDEAILSLQVEARLDIGNNDGERSWWDYLYLTDRQMELIADAIDFSVQPNVVTQEDVDNQPEMSNAPTQDGYTVELKDVETDGNVARITLGITAPEGTVISRTIREGYEDEKFFIQTRNLGLLSPAVGKISYGSEPMNPQEDGDGLDNTQDFVIEAQFHMMDGSEPFALGSTWNLRLEDLISTYYDSEKYTTVENVLAEGEWEWDITFGEEYGDYSCLEFVEEPITMSAITGWYADGTDAFDDVEVTSIKLRSMSLEIKHALEPVAVDFASGKHDMYIYAVMKDGTKIEADTWLLMENPIDLTQVDHLLLPDGRELKPVETEE